MECSVCGYITSNEVQLKVHCGSTIHKELLIGFIYNMQWSDKSISDNVQKILRNIQYIGNVHGKSYAVYIESVRSDMRLLNDNVEEGMRKAFLKSVNDKYYCYEGKPVGCVDYKDGIINIPLIIEDVNNNETCNGVNSFNSLDPVEELLKSKNECEYCGRVYKYSKGLAKHIADKHTF